jgi:8-oxo-dGTP pyrophosphatase MutT (NUDIX family)
MNPDPYQVLSRRQEFQGAIFGVVSDEVAMPGGGSARRDWATSMGAVAVVALDDAGRVVLIRQYRHPIGGYLWEIPAGLADVAGESGLSTAQRELAEEADLVAADWHLLIEHHSSPGFTDQLVRVFLARGLVPVSDQDRHVRHEEEADMLVRAVDLDDAVAMVFRGEITNGPALAGVLAAARARDDDWTWLRPADSEPPAPSPTLSPSLS